MAQSTTFLIVVSHIDDEPGGTTVQAYVAEDLARAAIAHMGLAGWTHEDTELGEVWYNDDGCVELRPTGIIGA